MILGIAATVLRGYVVLYIAILVVITLDMITGLIKAKINAGIDSGTAKRGFFGKIALLFAETFGVFLDLFIPRTLGSIGISLDVKLPFAMIICAYIVINESISICENLYVINPKSLPKSVTKILKIAKNEIEGDSKSKSSQDNNEKGD